MWFVIKFVIKPIPHYPDHLRQVATLPWEIKNANFQQISSTYGRKRKRIAFLSPHLCYSSTNFVYKIYVFTFAINSWQWLNYSTVKWYEAAVPVRKHLVISMFTLKTGQRQNTMGDFTFWISLFAESFRSVHRLIWPPSFGLSPKFGLAEQKLVLKWRHKIPVLLIFVLLARYSFRYSLFAVLRFTKHCAKTRTA